MMSNDLILALGIVIVIMSGIVIVAIIGSAAERVCNAIGDVMAERIRKRWGDK